MPDNYQDLVLAAYKKKRDTGGPSLILSKPTTAKLKKECLRIYDKRYTPEDDDILSTFFNVDKIGNDFRKIILSADTGVFRPLLNHLKNDLIKTHERNSELLAWLIDFKPRPSFLYYKTLLEEQRKNSLSNENGQELQNNIKEEQGLAEESNQEPISSGIENEDVVTNAKDTPRGAANVKDFTLIKDSSENDKGNIQPPILTGATKLTFFTPKAILVLSVFAILSCGVYVYWQRESTEIYVPTNTKEKCMHWAGNRYEPISCEDQTSKTPVIAINFQKLNHFKKINISDKLTKYDLGKVWYAKLYGKVEFYTDSGMHPIDTKRRLKPLTVYMLNAHTSYYKYLFNCILWLIGIATLSVILVGISFRYLPKRDKSVSVVR